MFRDIFSYHNWGGSATGIKRLEAKDEAEYPTMHNTVCTT